MSKDESTRYDEPNRAARAGNAVIRWLAELGISIAGTRSLRVRGRKTGKRRGVVINLLTVDGVDYVVSPRGNTQWARNVRAAGVVEMGPRWRQPTQSRSARWPTTPNPNCSGAIWTGGITRSRIMCSA